MAETDWNEKSFDFASDVSKQLITLATAIVTVTISFQKDIFSLTGGRWTTLLGLAWLAFLLSVVFGIWTLLALAGALHNPTPSIWVSSVMSPSRLQIASFGLGVLIAAAYVIEAIRV